MPKAVRFKANGKYLQHTMFSCPGLDYVGSGTPFLDGFDGSDPQWIARVAEDERLSIESWSQDFAIAFGIPVEQIECEVIPWDGDPDHLPKEDEADAIERIPEQDREGYVEPPPREPTLEEKVAAMLAAMPAAQQVIVTDALKG